MNDKFNQWLQSEHGKNCLDDSKQPIKNPYLKNRLWWAFEAGNNCNPQFLNMQQAIMKSFRKVAEMRRLLRAKDKHIKKLEEELQHERELRVGI